MSAPNTLQVREQLIDLLRQNGRYDRPDVEQWTIVGEKVK